MNDDAFAGLNIVDMSQGVAGPYLATMLALQGADVIKVEPPEGDWIRLMGGGADGMTALSIIANQGKRSLCIDARAPQGREVLLALLSRADVLVENFRPGVMRRLGLDYDTLQPTHPGLIHVSITGFGTSGPWVDKPGTDSVLQAFTGMAVLNGADGKPRRFAMLVPDTVTALYGAQSVAAALYARTRTGRGRHLELSLAGCCAAFQAAPILDDALFTGRAKPPVAVPSGVFATADGFVVLLALRNDMWERLCRALGCDAWLDEPRYATNALRGAHAAEINQRIEQVLGTRSTAEWIGRLERADVLCAEVQDYAAFHAHPQTRQMRWFDSLDQPPFGSLEAPRLPGCDAPLRAAPRTGEHTREVLAAAGLDAQQIAALERDGIVRTLDS